MSFFLFRLTKTRRAKRKKTAHMECKQHVGSKPYHKWMNRNKTGISMIKGSRRIDIC